MGARCGAYFYCVLYFILGKKFRDFCKTKQKFLNSTYVCIRQFTIMPTKLILKMIAKKGF